MRRCPPGAAPADRVDPAPADHAGVAPVRARGGDARKGVTARSITFLLLATACSAGDLAPLAERLDQGTSEERKALLSEIAADGSVDAVRLLLTQAHDPAMRDAVVDALVSMPGTAAIEWLFATGLSFPDPQVRAVSVLALGRSALRLKRALPDPVVERLADDDPSVRAAVAESLGASGDVAHVERLKTLLADRVWSVRLAAASALSEMDATGAATAILALARDADLTVRREAVGLLAAHSDAEFAARAGLHSDDPRVRALAASSLARIGCTPAKAVALTTEIDLPALSALAAWHYRTGPVASLIEALAKRAEPDARLAIAWFCVPEDEAQARRLVELASKDTDARVRDGLRASVLRGDFSRLLVGDLAVQAGAPREPPPMLARRIYARPVPETVAAAVDCACWWLARHQESDGRWSCAKNNPWTGGIPFPDFIEEDRYVDAGVTGLAVLVLLGQGSFVQEELGGVARRGVEYLLSCQARNGKIDSAPSWAPSLTGSASPHDPNPHPSNASNYNHTIGALALAEAYAMSGDEALRGPAQRAIAHLFDAETAADLPWGGYLRGEDAAPSVFAIQALVVAREAGLDVDPAWLDLARDYVEALSDPATGRPRFQHVMPYCLGGYDGSATLLTCRAFLGMPLDDEAATRAFALIDPHRPNWNAHFEIPKGVPRSPSERWRNDDDILNFWYFRFASIAQRSRGGEGWERWHRELASVLVPMQRIDGDDTGSWDPEGAWSRVGGRVYSTAFCALALQAAYAYDLAHR